MAILKDINLPLDKSVWMLTNTEKCTELAHLVRTANEIIDLAYDHDVTAVAEDNNKVADQIKDLLHNAVRDDQPTFVLYNKVKRELLVLPIDYSSDMDEEDMDLSDVADYAAHRLPPVCIYNESVDSDANQTIDIDTAENTANPNKFSKLDREIIGLIKDKELKITKEDITKRVENIYNMLKASDTDNASLRVDENFRIWAMNGESKKEVGLGAKLKVIYLWVLGALDGVMKSALKDSSVERDRFWNIYKTITKKEGKASLDQFVNVLLGIAKEETKDSDKKKKKQQGIYGDISNITKAIDIAFDRSVVASKFKISTIRKDGKSILQIPAVKEGLVSREDSLYNAVTLE